MIVSMPFLHRMRAATIKTPQPREIAVADREFITLGKRTASDFEQGARIGNWTTLVAEGGHWASLTSVYPNEGYGSEGRDPIDHAFKSLSMSIGCERFYADEWESLPLTSVLQKSPPPSMIESSQREVNVSKLANWATDNLVSVDGVPFVRVKEPTVHLTVYGPFGGRTCFLRLSLTKTAPEADDRYDYGIMSTISGRHELLKLANRLLASERGMLRVENDIAPEAFDQMTSAAEDEADVAKRSLVRFAWETVRTIHINSSPERLVKGLRPFFRHPRPEFGQDDLDRMAELIGRDAGNLDCPRDIVAGIIVDRWHQRPVELTPLGRGVMRHAR
jgi:hypothetical protein